CQAVQWTKSLPDQTTVNACLGGDVLFNWNYTLADGETVEDIKWHQANDKSNQPIGVYTANSFVVMPTFSGRARHSGAAALTLENVTGPDEGNYSVEITVLNLRPPAVDGSLTMTQNRAAVVDNVTGELHVDISCGTFTDLGQPPISVVWK
ncbi:hypothetical protein BaRGS_00039472, partial [Batillaria attramentaria]